MINKILVVVCGLLAFQGYVFAETWEDRAANKTPWSTEFPDDPVCWNPPVWTNTENPWIVGRGDTPAYDGLRDCFRLCAENDTCYKDGWQDTDAGSARCRVRGAPRAPAPGFKSDGVYYWWEAKIALNEIEFPIVGFSPGKLHSIAWCE